MIVLSHLILPPCEESDLDPNCIYGWKENSISEWKNIHNNIKDKIDKKMPIIFNI